MEIIPKNIKKNQSNSLKNYTLDLIIDQREISCKVVTSYYLLMDKNGLMFIDPLEHKAGFSESISFNPKITIKNGYYASKLDDIIKEYLIEKCKEYR